MYYHLPAHLFGSLLWKWGVIVPSFWSTTIRQVKTISLFKTKTDISQRLIFFCCFFVFPHLKIFFKGHVIQTVRPMCQRRQRYNSGAICPSRSDAPTQRRQEADFSRYSRLQCSDITSRKNPAGHLKGYCSIFEVVSYEVLVKRNVLATGDFREVWVSVWYYSNTEAFGGKRKVPYFFSLYDVQPSCWVWVRTLWVVSP